MASIARRVETIYLSGNPDEIRTVRIFGTVMTGYIIPRKMLSDAKKIIGIDNPGIYYLIKTDTKESTEIYVGKTTQGIVRLADHDKNKDWWDKAILFLADAQDFDSTVISGLEKLAINRLIDCNRFLPYNIQKSNVSIKGGIIYDIQGYYDDIEFLMATLGYSFVAKQATSNNEVLYLVNTRVSVSAKGVYLGERFELFEGSEINFVRKVNLKSLEKRRHDMLKSGDIKLIDGKYILKKNIDFNSISAASDFVVGGSTNGWVVWKDESGQTADELYRQDK